MLFEIKNLEYIIENNKILSKKNLTIGENNHLLILGPSGCGKTTLINLMSGLLKPSSGEVIFMEKNLSLLTTIELDSLRFKYFGFIFQKLHLLGHLNIEQNILLAKNGSNLINVDKLINDLGLFKKKKIMANDLSQGEAQRVAIARGMINQPKVIFADEPTSALDEINTKKVMELIFSSANKIKTTLIVSTHDKRIKKYFSNILEM